jgi:hypothetical protein
MMSGRVMIRVSIMTLILLAYLIIFNILIILKPRMKVVDDPKGILIINVRIVEIIEERTITKSKILSVTLK